MKRDTILGIVAAALIFFGFGMQHITSTTAVIGNIMIGVGCLYFIYRLYLSIKNSK